MQVTGGKYGHWHSSGGSLFRKRPFLDPSCAPVRVSSLLSWACGDRPAHMSCIYSPELDRMALPPKAPLQLLSPVYITHAVLVGDKCAIRLLDT